ncbi:hypothetical protein B0H11DRAFT_1908696 [Mycena galericulata]|nr:hypothetical protein B0H11DRAFT_1908696 [Mycena galericulata]
MALLLIFISPSQCISGGEFTHTMNFINNATCKTCKTSGIKDFRQIRLGDLDLREEKRLSNTVGTVRLDRRVYAARVHGRQNPMTVVKWLEEVKKYEGLRLPTLVQVFGIVQSKQLYATVYEDGQPIGYLAQYYSSPTWMWDCIVTPRRWKSAQGVKWLTYLAFTLGAKTHACCLPDNELHANVIRSTHVETTCVGLCPQCQFHDSGWILSYRYRNLESICTEMGNGWIRFWFPCIPAPCKDLIGRTISMADGTSSIKAAWHSQANHIFGTKNDLDSYAFIEETNYWVSLLDSGHPPAKAMLAGGIFLFLSPVGATQKSGLGGLAYPFPAFWSLDPSGSCGLLPEDATAIGLPILSGFNPYSLEVALNIGLPLYQPSLHDGVYPHVQLVDATDSDA